jgi:hypothetical protein
MVERENPVMPASRQCRLLAVSRAAVYRKPAAISAEDLAIVTLIDRQYPGPALFLDLFQERLMAKAEGEQGSPPREISSSVIWITRWAQGTMSKMLPSRRRGRA